MDNTLLNFLIKNNYKTITRYEFIQRVKEFLGVHEISNEQNVIYFSHPKGYEIDLKNQFINSYEVDLNYLIEMQKLEKGTTYIYNNRFICYNKIIFNDDISSITQILFDKEAIEDVVIYFDYEKNQNLLNFALNNLDINNEEIIYLQHIIFYNDKSKEFFFKKDLLIKILEKYEVFFIRIIQVFIEFWEYFSMSDSKKYPTIAFMLDILLNKYHKEFYDISHLAYLVLNNSYIEKKEILQNFIGNNYYNYTLLKEYSKFYLFKE